MKYIALDIGSVLCTVDIKPVVNTVSEVCNVSLEESMSFLKRMQKMHDLGLTTMEYELKEKFHIRSEALIEKVHEDWLYAVTPHLPMLDMLNYLKENVGIKIALLSNIGLEHAEMMPKVLNHNGFYDDTIKWFSCEVGARKPSFIYYQSFLSQHPEFKGCLYVDDLAENLTSGAQFGFRTFQLDLSEAAAEEKIKEISQIMIQPKAK